MNQGAFLEPSLRVVPIIISTTGVLLALLAFWYFVGLRWHSAFVHRHVGESLPGPEAGTVETLLRFADYAERTLERMVASARALFLILVLAVALAPLLFSIAFAVSSGGGALPTIVFLAVVFATFAACIYLFSEIGREFDDWKRRIAWLRAREKAFVENQQVSD